VLLSTLVQGSTFEPLAKRLRVTTMHPALPRPLAETGTVRALGAEVVEFPVAPADAVAGCFVRDLGLPREALLNVIVRGAEAIPPRGSTLIEAGDRLHLLIRKEVAGSMVGLMERWREGPMREPAPERRSIRAHRAVLTVRPWKGRDAHPAEVEGVAVIRHLRTRHDVPGALVLLADGRYAITGPLLAVGPPRLLERHIRRQLHVSGSEQERAWWQEVAGALISSSL
jgi:cell volume regulation protein A